MSTMMIQPTVAQTQRDLILSHLKQGAALTQVEALNLFGCMRLAARIEELRDAGEPIVTERIVEGDRTFARYRRIASLPRKLRRRAMLVNWGRRRR